MRVTAIVLGILLMLAVLLGGCSAASPPLSTQGRPVETHGEYPGSPAYDNWVDYNPRADIY